MRKLLLLPATVLALAAAPVWAADEPTVLEGKGTDDGAVKFFVHVDGKVKKGAVTGAITRVVMENAKFECKFQGGPSGRNDYFWGPVPPEEPPEIGKNGKFKIVSENVAGTHVLSRYTLKGKATVRGKVVTLTGTFQAQLSEGGLEFGACETAHEGFKVKGKL